MYAYANQYPDGRSTVPESGAEIAPHSPNSLGVYKVSDNITLPPVLFFTNVLCVGPALPTSSVPRHGSEFGVLVLGTAATSMVAVGTSVFVGKGVGLEVSVGGTGVFVGIAACVSATMVNAAATAVDWMSSALIAGSVG